MDENMELDREMNPEMEEDDPKKDRVIQNKLLFVVLCFVVFMVPVLWFFGVGNPVNADGVFVGNITRLEDGRLEIPMMLEGSAVAFTITTQELEEDTLLLKPRFSLVGLHKSGSVTITTKVPVDEVDYIYIQGDDESDRLMIWNNTEG